jgi:hypothetical protein
MKEAKHFVEEGVHPQLIIKAYREASNLVIFVIFMVTEPLYSPSLPGVKVSPRMGY